MDEQVTQLVTFELNKIYFGIDVFKIDRIIKKENLIDLPNKKTGYLIAMIRFEDEIISVVSLRKRFNMSLKSTAKEKIIVINHDNNLVGLLVDDVRKLVEVEKFEPIKSKTVMGLPVKLFSGKVIADEKDIFIVEVENLLDYKGELNFKQTKKLKKRKTRKKGIKATDKSEKDERTE